MSNKKLFKFDTHSQRYRITSGEDKGKLVTASELRSLIEATIDFRKDQVRAVTQALLNGNTKVSTWENAVSKALKDAHTQAYLIGKGGVNQIVQRDYGVIGGELKKEYKYLREFSKEILAGELTEAQIRDRVTLYIDAIHGSYELGRMEGHKASGYAFEQRIRNSSESCAECLMYAARGVVPIGTLPNPGEDCTCRSRCRCHKEFFREKPTDSLLGARFGFVGASFNSFGYARAIK